MTTRQLGQSDIHVSPIGLGTMQFSGKSAISALVPAIPQQQVDAIIKAALGGGITWFDTAELHGFGKSERALSAGLTNAGITPGDVTVATKWLPLGRTARSIERTIGKRTSALHPFPIDLHQIHWGAGSFSSVRAQVRSMARLVQAGKVRAVGVSNFTPHQMEIAHDELAKFGIPLAANEIQINLLHREIETNGMLDTARRLGITLIAYSPLGQGLLTGKFHADRSLLADVRLLRRKAYDVSENAVDRSAPLIDAMREIATTHDATVGQVGLAWLTTFYGDTVVAIPGASKPHHAEEAAGALKVQLSADEVERLSEVSRYVIN
jgi:aryl-alcohol dehydrogenase-like predicted oxidoreductase